MAETEPSGEPPNEPPTVVSFTVERGQVWIGPDEVSWYVVSVGAENTMLERTVVETVNTRDLVREYRQPRECVGDRSTR